MKRDSTPLLLGAVFVFVLAAGPWLPQWALFILTLAFAQGLVALGLMLLLRAGLVSFGQALYYCLGAYSAGALGRFLHVSDIFVEMLAGGAVATLVAWVLGFLLAKYRGIFFGLLSLALSMILYGLLVKTEALGSTDGFNILPSTLFGVRPGGQWVRYAVAAAAALAGTGCALLVHRHLNTPLGRLAPAIKDNEIRVEYMGASVRHAIHVKYVVAAALAGIGGALAATTVGHIDPEMAYWTTSGTMSASFLPSATFAPTLSSAAAKSLGSYSLPAACHTASPVTQRTCLIPVSPPFRCSAMAWVISRPWKP